ncbi:hypothetical protein SPRG_08968 [Saprolegnia parasitica CBS 223.65]|uniref:Kazal-like domain-containing protein n=1 Tax=Saprolegnia parasitica (strain CBS 223.65) TaxID=695850 RepID=A0A067C4J1_SAPPC|nr:hypothetical protein SPRG_08968 [Saprolegnia parasitica CBS 223.65]KDO25669.1 hypothetical protein SPRG_08968 [Saprolegnia parasitica CBS 223.65]|eukprot:XP_012203699.1 hypothetical protein SPRG_08968 [Saprolegnia parasitica CBS 223.65]
MLRRTVALLAVACVATRACGDEMCPPVVVELQCGSDGVIYMNACLAEKKKCSNRAFTYTAGACPKKTPLPRRPMATVDLNAITFPRFPTPHLRAPTVDEGDEPRQAFHDN